MALVASGMFYITLRSQLSMTCRCSVSAACCVASHTRVMPSLTGELRSPRSPLREFLESTFPNVKAVLTGWTRPPIVVVPPPGIASHVHGRIGTTFDFRLRLVHGPLPTAGTAAHRGWEAIDRIAALRERHQRRGVTIAAQKVRRVALRSRGEDPVSLILRAMNDITGGNLCPLDTLTKRDEARLVRLCWLLALYEECWRGGLRPDHPLVVLGPHPSWDHLTSVFPDRLLVDDLTALCRLTAKAAPDILQGPAICNPEFNAPGLNADGDLVIDGCLWEIKTSARPGFDRKVLFQLLAYCLLDRSDRFNLGEVALFRVRFGAVQRWSLLPLLEQLADRPIDLKQLREDFAGIVAGAYGPRPRAVTFAREGRGHAHQRPSGRGGRDASTNGR